VAHKQGINISDIPQTFLHAAEIAVWLNITYLWIDSLCILQDDAKDWEREAARIVDFYANSHLTISADSSTDDSTGCFVSKETRLKAQHVSSDNISMHRPCYANAAPLMFLDTGTTQPYFMSARGSAASVFDISDGGKSRIYISDEWMPSSLKSEPKLYQIGAFGTPFDPIASEPLSSRGWTLQERLLPPRILHYTDQQMYWECQECMIPEDGADFPRIFPSLRPIFRSLENQLETLSITPNLPNWYSRLKNFTPVSPQHGRWGDLWLYLIEEYSQRNLTFGKDKLPAISGLARTIASYTKDTYHAGSWKTHILMGLYWQVYALEPYHMCHDPEHDREITERTPPEKPDVVYPSEYRAPTWSWASVDARISFTALNLDNIVAKLINCHTPLAGVDGFGMLKEGGSITLHV